MDQKKKGGNTVSAVWEIAQPIAESLGLILWDVCFVKEGSSWFLRIFIDKPGGVSLNDCEAMSRAVDGPLDDADPIEQSYYLEVSSPGIGRVLTRASHFEVSFGAPVKIRLIRPRDGKRDFEGVLLSFSDGKIAVREEKTGEELFFNKTEAAWVRLCDDFGGLEKK